MDTETKKPRRNRRSKREESIVANLETGPIAAPVIDHETQLASWTSPEPDVAHETDASVADLVQDEALIPVEVIEDVVQELEANESAETTTAEDPVQSQPAEDEAPTLDALIAALDPDQVKDMVVSIDRAFADRQAFETEVDPDNANIHRTLKKAREWMTRSTWPAAVMMVSNVDPSFINRSIHEGARYNVYVTMVKLTDPWNRS